MSIEPEYTDFQIYFYVLTHYGRSMARNVLRALIEGGGFGDHVRRSFSREMRELEDAL